VPDLLESLRAVEPPDAERPYTIVNFVAGVDGRASFGGRSGALGDDGDRAIFHGLREQADAVLAGTVTIRTEVYGRILGKPERRERRVDRGLSPEPLATVISRSGEIPTGAPLFAEPEARIVVFSSSELDLDGATAQITEVHLDPGEMTLTTALRRLRADYGVRLLLCEGGPTLFNAMLREQLVDELFLTLAPKLTGGGTEPGITAGPEFAAPQELELRWLLERNNSLYLRYALPTGV
jgi:riboflavin biosynthesis pyrimidine reductase